MNSKLSIELCGDLDFEGMLLDITYNGEAIASINYEEGIDNMEIELLPKSEEIVFPLEEFLLVLEKAKKLAIKCAKEDEDFKKKGIDF